MPLSFFKSNPKPAAAPSRQYVIIGSGVAGFAAAQAIRARSLGAKITIIGDDPSGYYSRPGLAYLLTGEMGESGLFPMSKNEIKALNLEWISTRAEVIHPNQHQITLAGGSMLAYDRLLIATGSLASGLRTPGTDLEGVFKLDNLADARAILKYCRKARVAVVSGGGITALELVEGLRAQGLTVHYFLRGDRYWSNVLDEAESRLVEAKLTAEGVTIHYHTELAAVLGEKGRVSAVQSKEGRQVPCQMVAFAIGVLPRKELAQTAGLLVERGILVDEYLQTSAADIFAAGDVAQVFDPYSGQSVLDTLWNTARQQGYAAGLNMAGVPTRYLKDAPLNVTRLGGLTTTIIGTVGKGVDPSLAGIARGDSETWRQLPVHSVAESGDSDNRLRVLIGEKRLLGAIVMGDQTISLALQELISSQADISPIRDVLLRSKRLTEIITPFWKHWRSTRHAQPQS